MLILKYKWGIVKFKAQIVHSSSYLVESCNLSSTLKPNQQVSFEKKKKSTVAKRSD